MTAVAIVCCCAVRWPLRPVMYMKHTTSPISELSQRVKRRSDPQTPRSASMT